MPFVIREHAQLLARLNGVKFDLHACGSISEEIDDAAAAKFLAVPGHRLAEDHEIPGFVAPVSKPAPAAAKSKAGKGAAAAAALAVAAETEGNAPDVTDAETSGEPPSVPASAADSAASADVDSIVASAADTPLF